MSVDESQENDEWRGVFFSKMADKVSGSLNFLCVPRDQLPGRGYLKLS